MSTTANPALTGTPAARNRLLDSTIGKKAVMAITGLMLVGFVIGHMVGNLQIYLGQQKLDAYGALLHSMPGLLWGARAALLLAVTLHIVSAVQLAALQQKARPTPYAKKKSINSTYASRTMYWSGPILLAFIIYHLLHFTTGTVLPGYEFGAVYRNAIIGFSNPLVSAFYIVSMILLGLHLYHGIWSMLQTLGINHPTYTPIFRRIAAGIAIIVAVGNISIPISVLAGVVK